ncbi:MAG TPA: helix-turn-helix transcriptional regulator [Pseudonocardiaceae bacterium]|nr:helix-turn-helix transcriptional regulator [Pseudonocardiaceae bacterium]
MKEKDPTTRTRELGAALRHAMDRASLSGREFARKVDWSQATISKLLNGKVYATEVDVATFLAVCEVTGEERKRLLKLAREQDDEGWLQQYGSRVPKQVKTLVQHEDRATAIREFESWYVPGLLQIRDYARAAIKSCVNVPAEEVEDRVDARLTRQNIFDRFERPDFTFYIHEFALRLPMGGAAVMSAQLHELLRLSVRRYLNIRVIPASVGGHAGMAGAFRLMEFAEFNSVIYLEGETSGVFLEKEEQITAYENILEGLAAAALSEGQSRDCISDLAVELYPDGEDHDDGG